MNTENLIITVDQRRAIHRQVIQHLSGIGDVYQGYANGGIADAERFGGEYAEDLRLLEDLGWAPDDDRDSFELTMPGEKLLAVLARLHGEAEEGMGGPEEGRAAEEAEEVRVNYERTAEVCAELLASVRQEAPTLDRGDRPGAVGMTAATELGAFSPVSGLTLLTAVERAERHDVGPEKRTSSRDVAEHLGFLWSPAVGRKLTPLLLALESDGWLTLGERAGGGSLRCRLTRRGQNRLQTARRAVVPEALLDSLPESPQHRTWRQIRGAAVAGANDFLGSATTAVQEAETVLLNPMLAPSMELMAIGQRLRLHFWRLASVTYCLHEWAEPNERSADLEEKPQAGFWPFPRRAMGRWPDAHLFAKEAIV